MARVAPKKAARKSATKKNAAAGPAVKKAATKKAAVKKASVKKVAPQKSATGGLVAKKAAVRKTAPVKKATAKTASPTTALRDPMSKAQLVTALAESTGLSKQDVGAVLGELNTLIERHVKKRSAGQFTLPGLFKIRTVKKKATKARKGRNPFTGEEIMIAAKPARTSVKVMPLKGLKEMAEK
ncbi:MAG: HU family DNA-binding protein [Gammaproteobacteria bacterium]|nr:HU family DNA-binding protein [Gammaproteobacteria bacterium]